MGWFENLMPSRIKTKNKNQQVPDGLWKTCQSCGEVLYGQDLEYNLQVCPKCGHHMRIKARQRLEWLFDKDQTIVEIGESLLPVDILKFKDSKRYKDRITAANKSSGENEALIAMSGAIYKLPVTAVAFEFSYMGGSMGSVVGERFVRAVEYALEHHTPFVCFSASGGARMQEGLTSLFQMTKTSAALTRLEEAGLPYISVLTDPTMGGVSASLAMLGNLIIAEPNALIGFAGPRVIEQTVRETLPEGFQRSEFLIKKGAIDRIVDRRDMRQELSSLLALLLNKPVATTPVDETQIANSQEDFTLTSKESLAESVANKQSSVSEETASEPEVKRKEDESKKEDEDKIAVIKEETPKEAPAKDALAKDALAKDALAKDAAAKDAAAKDAAAKDATTEEISTKKNEQ